MKTVSIIFRRSKAVGSYVLRTCLWSQWSHCGIIDGDCVIEASAFHGVVRTPLNAFISVASGYEIVDVSVQNEDAATAILVNARSQIGKPYDYAGLFGIALRARHWENTQKWMCSELVAWAFAEAGYPLVRKPTWRITPQDIYLPFYR